MYSFDPPPPPPFFFPFVAFELTSGAERTPIRNKPTHPSPDRKNVALTPNHLRDLTLDKKMGRKY